jgi:hypothetical protein
MPHYSRDIKNRKKGLLGYRYVYDLGCDACLLVQIPFVACGAAQRAGGLVGAVLVPVVTDAGEVGDIIAMELCDELAVGVFVLF